MHACFVFWIMLVPLVSLSVSSSLVGRLVVSTLQGTSRFHRNLQLFPSFFDGFLELSISRSMKQMPLNFRALSSFGLSMAHRCFFLFVELFLTWQTIFFCHRWSGLVVAGICVSRSSDHKKSFKRYLIQKCYLRESCP